ncbi:1250_t:CDS:2, partial [Funneliformis caledonium]
ATTGMLTDLVNETKILFLRARDPSHSARLQLAMLVTPGFIQSSRTISFLKSKINSYYADHRTRLNTEIRAYGEDYIYNNLITLDNIPTIENLKLYVDETCRYQCFKTSMTQVSEDWWDENLTDVETF